MGMWDKVEIRKIQIEDADNYLDMLLNLDKVVSENVKELQMIKRDIDRSVMHLWYIKDNIFICDDDNKVDLFSFEK